MIIVSVILISVALIAFIVGYYVYMSPSYGLISIKINDTDFLLAIAFIVGISLIRHIFVLYRYTKDKEQFMSKDNFESNFWFALRMLLIVSTLGFALLGSHLGAVNKKSIERSISKNLKNSGEI